MENSNEIKENVSEEKDVSKNPDESKDKKTDTLKNLAAIPAILFDSPSMTGALPFKAGLWDIVKGVLISIKK